MTIRHRLVVWLGVCVLVMQALIPAAAMSHDAAPSPFVLCTAEGAKLVAALPGMPQPRPKGFAGLPCEHCVVSSVTALAPPPDLALAEPIRRAEAATPPAPAERRPPARAPPPRPPSQGPPLSA